VRLTEMESGLSELILIEAVLMKEFLPVEAGYSLENNAI